MKVSLVFIGLLLIASVHAFYEANSKVVKLTADNFEEEVLASNELWLVEFYAPWCGHCKALAPEFDKAAKGLEGFIKLGAVDMTTDGKAGEAYGISGYPTLKFFGADKSQPMDYTGGRKAYDIVNFCIDQARNIAMKKMGLKKKQKEPKEGEKTQAKKDEEAEAKMQQESAKQQEEEEAAKQNQQKEQPKQENNGEDVIELTDDDFEEIVMNSQDAWFIKFYAPWCGHCKKLAPVWNEIATELKGEVKFGSVDATVNSALAQRFKISGYPGLKWFPAGLKSDEQVVDHNGGREKGQLIDWCKEQKLKGKPLAFQQLVDQQTFEEFCSGFSGVCVITFVPHIYDTNKEQRNELLAILKETAQRYKGKPFTFLWSEGGVQYQFEDSFGQGGSGYPSVIAYSHQKKVYSVLKGAFSKSTFEDFIKRLVYGKESFIPINKELKVKKVVPWDGQDSKIETNSEEL